MAYSIDLRIRVLDFVMKGNIMQSASKNFRVHHNTIGEWLKALYEEERVTPKEPYRQAPYKLNWESLEQFVKLYPDLTQAEYAKHFDVSQG